MLRPRLALAAACLVSGMALPGRAPAQEGPAADPVPSTLQQLGLPPPVLTLDQDRLFRESAWGRAAIQRAEADGAALSEENRRIDAALESEERSLTERRATVSAEEFAGLAAAFDAKVEEIRAAQENKSRTITRQLEEDRRQFFERITPILGDLLAESGAAAILADGAVIMALTSLDITPEAIKRIDAALPAPAPTPAPTPAPQPGTQP